jgi:methylase of polypeptide subunit release factors
MTPDYSRFIATLTAFADGLPGDDAGVDGPKTTSAAIIARLMNNVRLGYYPTELTHVDLIVRGIAFPEGVTTNLLDPCCGCGIALRRIADGNNCWAYGVEMDEDRAEESQDRLHRVAVGSYFHSRISHEAFHLLFLNPPYLNVIKEGGGNTRSEKMFLVDAMKHLAMGGLLVYIIPYYRITADIARVLCDNFTDLSVYRFMGKEFDRFKQVAVFGVHKPRENGAGLVDAFMSSIVTAGVIPELSDLPEGRYPLPPHQLTVQVFKGAVFNVLELQRQLKASKSIARLLERSELDSREKRPLLPLNVGQIGLIAGSGMINGLAKCESPHVIKGRIVKETVSSLDGSEDCGILTETHTNRMIFNILTPGGLRSLT